MAINWGLALANVGRAAGNVRDERAQRQERLEDRLAQKEMRDLQKRSLEEALERPLPAEPLVITLDEQGNPVHTPRSQAAGRRAPRPAEPLEVVIGKDGPTYTPRSQAAGKAAPKPAEPLVQVATPEGGNVLTPRSQAVGKSAPMPAGATGAADKRKRAEALGNVSAALDAFEQSLSTTGATVMPSMEKDVLQTNYENLQLQLKELFNLGVLNGPDLALMRRIIQDPTSIRGRALSFGNDEEQTKRVLAQIQTMRAKLGTFRSSAGVQEVPQVPRTDAPDHSAMSDEEFAKAYKAGAFKKP